MSLGGKHLAKRFTDNEKWKKQFFKSLSTVNKLFFLYILDECDNAGIWHVEPEIASMRIGDEIDIELAKKELGKHIHEFDNGEKWFVPFFIDFQYGKLNPSVNAHKSVIDKLAKRGLTKIYEQLTNCCSRDMDKDMDKDMDVDKDKDSEPVELETLWRRIYLRNPGKVELDFVSELVEKHGMSRAKEILYSLRENNFHSIRKMKDSLDEKGNIIPLGEQSEYTYEEALKKDISLKSFELIPGTKKWRKKS